MDFGVNLNGDSPIEEIKEAAMAAEEAGFSHIWVGESINYLHPFPIMAACLEYTENIKVGSGIISPQRTRRFHIRRAVSTLKEVYGPRIVVGLAPGDRYGLMTDCIDTGGILSLMEKSVHRFKETDPQVPVFVGASGPRLINLAGEKADGVLLNYVHPRYVRWALRYLGRHTYTAVYGPSLLLPNDYMKGSLRGSAAVVVAGSNHVFLREMGLTDFASNIRGIVKEDKWGDLANYEKELLEGFTISGSMEDISRRIEEYMEMGIDQVIFGVPFGRDIEGIRRMEEIIPSFSR
jgi:5,10-methylenetetrahydromethanopterin reductase